MFMTLMGQRKIWFFEIENINTFVFRQKTTYLVELYSYDLEKEIIEEIIKFKKIVIKFLNDRMNSVRGILNYH